MVASINDYFTHVNNGTVAEPAQLSAGKATIDTTASLTLATGWPTDTGIHIAIFKVGTDGDVTDGTVTYWKATLSGTTLSNMTIKGGINQAYATGDPVIILSPEMFNDLVDGILIEHNQDGTHGSITISGTSAHTGVATFLSNLDINDSSTAIRDTSDNELIKFAKTASAVNEITVTNAATAGAPSIAATGGDTNIPLVLNGKGTGAVKTTLRSQADTTSTTNTAAFKQEGWGYVAAASGSTAAKAITFPTAFTTSVINIKFGTLGFKGTTAPTSITDFNTAIGGETIGWSTTGISTTGFTANGYKTVNYASNTNYYGFWWEATGV